MRSKYFKKNEIDLVNKKNMVCVDYQEIYNMGSRHGVPDCIIVEQKNILCDNYQQTLWEKSTKRPCKYCNRIFGKYYLIKHTNQVCKKNPNRKTKKHIPHEEYD